MKTSESELLSYSDLERRNDGYRAMCGSGTTKSPSFPKELEGAKTVPVSQSRG